MIQVKKSIECSVNWKIPIREAVLPFRPPWAELGAYLAVRTLLGEGSGAGPLPGDAPPPRGRTDGPGPGREGPAAGRGWGGGRLPVVWDAGIWGWEAPILHPAAWQHQGQWPRWQMPVVSLLPCWLAGPRPCPSLWEQDVARLWWAGDPCTFGPHRVIHVKCLQIPVLFHFICFPFFF